MGEGWWGASNLAIMELNVATKTISRVASYPINTSYFGEGVTYYPADGKVYQLTWKDGVLVVYENLISSGYKPTFHR
jgi:glutamine cyclotransferase